MIRSTENARLAVEAAKERYEQAKNELEDTEYLTENIEKLEGELWKKKKAVAAKAAAISESFREQSGIRGVMMFCKDYMGKGEVTKVYKKFGAGAIGIIKENPYILAV